MKKSLIGLLFIIINIFTLSNNVTDKNLKDEIIRYNNGVKEIIIPKMKTDFFETLDEKYPVQPPVILKNKDAKYTIVIDPGHGGKDPGGRGYGYNEKDIALLVSQKLVEELKNDYNIILTRNEDFFIPLYERANIGNREKGDLFISIHLNAGRSSANGAEVFYYEKKAEEYVANHSYEEEQKPFAYDTLNETSYITYIRNQFKSSEVAKDVLDNIVNDFGLRKRGVFGANFAVLRGSNSPAILVELGFMTNYGDVSKFITTKGQEKAAKSIARAVRKHFKE